MLKNFKSLNIDVDKMVTQEKINHEKYTNICY